MGKVCFPQLPFDIPFPVGEKTIAPTIPDPHHKPAEGCGKDYDQLKLPCFPPNPEEHIAQNDQNMQREERYVEKFQHSI